MITTETPFRYCLTTPSLPKASPVYGERLAKLIPQLWQPLPQTEAIQNFFESKTILAYPTKIGECSYADPFFHRFYVPTEEGLEWLQRRYEKKYGLSISLVGTASQFKEIEAKVMKQESPHFEPLIIMDKTGSSIHVTPCIFIKNTAGVFFYQMDSIAKGAPFFSYSYLQSLLSPGTYYVIDQEKRQIDGFSCRVDAFVIIKELYKVFKAHPEMTPQAFLRQITPSISVPGAWHGRLRGSLLKTSQRIIQDSSKTDLIVGTSTTLEEMQKMFVTRHCRLINTIKASSDPDYKSSSVYIQCKALKYVLECQRELEEADNQWKQFKLDLNAEF